ncbi:mitochondria-eating protein-like [Dendronephthya gigantea]|uniref:mitochondria-eating protein-like n=1 Tax=Dendronephthya gigantea TaxID=151771 RepID=UPI00106A4C91|nr:mitochondria-eating protein-like [Dendronephthya gigantea]
MTKWATLIAVLKQKNYEDALEELAVIQNYDDLQDALQVLPFKSLNQDLPTSLVLLEKLYAKFMLFATDKDEGRLIIRHVFKVDFLLRNFIQFEVENALIGGLERNMECEDLIGHIMQVTFSMDRSVVEELTSYGTRLKSALEHYQNCKTLITDYGFDVDDIKSNLQTCLTKYHFFIHNLESLIRVSKRKHSEGKGCTVVYKGGHDTPRKTSKTRYNSSHLTRSKSLVTDVTSHRGSVERVRKRLVFNQAVLDVIEPCKEDIEQGPRLLQNLKELVENDNKFLDAISELSSQISSPCFAHIKLERILSHFINSYDTLLSSVASLNEANLIETEESGQKRDGISRTEDDEKCTFKKEEKPTTEDTQTGLVNNGLKIDVTTPSPFYRRLKARRPLRTHSCKEPGSEKRAEILPRVHHKNESEVQESKLKEKLEMKDKQLTETRALVKNLKKREEQLLEKLTAQAKNHLLKSEKFENVSAEFPRTEQLIREYDDLYSQSRLEAMDDLDDIGSLNCLERSDEIKSQITFAVMVVSFHLVGQELESRKMKIYALLGIKQEKKDEDEYASLKNEITLQFRKSASEIDLKHIVDEVLDGLLSTMFEFSELSLCQQLRHFAEACVRFSWTISTRVQPLILSYDDTSFTSSSHSKSHNSDKDRNAIRYHVWPALLDSQTNAVLFKGIVTT